MTVFSSSSLLSPSSVCSGTTVGHTPVLSAKEGISEVHAQTLGLQGCSNRLSHYSQKGFISEDDSWRERERSKLGGGESERRKLNKVGKQNIRPEVKHASRNCDLLWVPQR